MSKAQEIIGFQVAPIDSPAFTGTPTVPTQSQNNNSTRIATTAYTDLAVSNAIAAVNPAVAVQAATSAVLPNTPTYLNGVAGIGATLTTATLNTALVVDGYTPALLERILVKNQASSFQNGVYYVSQLAAVGLAWILTRALDYDMPSDMNNTGAIPVINGTANTTTSWVQSSSVTTVGTDAVTFAQFSYAPSTIALLASPTFTGTPSAPTASSTTNTTQLATTAFVQTAINNATWTDWSGSVNAQGFTGSVTYNAVRYQTVGKLLTLQMNWTGTSNATTMTCTLPVAMANTAAQVWIVRVNDSGALQTGVAIGAVNSTTLTFGKASSGAGGFTNSGTKGVQCTIMYETT